MLNPTSQMTGREVNALAQAVSDANPDVTFEMAQSVLAKASMLGSPAFTVHFQVGLRESRFVREHFATLEAAVAAADRSANCAHVTNSFGATVHQSF